jgi:hypothetical protein
MKKKLTILLTVFTSFAISAQTFLQSTETDWSYEYQYQAYTPNGYTRIYHDGDSLIDGKLTKRLIQEGQYTKVTGPNTTETTSLETYDILHVYTSQDSVYIWRENNFHLAFKTAGIKGDIWDLGPFAEASSSGATDSHAYLKVDSVYTKETEGISYTEMLVSICDQAGIELEINQGDSVDFFVVYSGVIHEKFGALTNLHLMKSIYQTGIINETYSCGVLCYSDISTSQIEFTNNQDCYNNLFVGLEELNLEQSVVLYPNPANGKVTIESEGLVFEKIEITDQLGKTVLTVQPTSFRTNVELNRLKPGVYMVKLTSKNSRAVKRLLIH